MGQHVTNLRLGYRALFSVQCVQSCDVAAPKQQKETWEDLARQRFGDMG